MTRDDGFTLMETLVATFIFALISGSAVLLLTSMQRGEAALRDVDERTGSVSYAHSLMKSDLLAALPRPVRDEFGGGAPQPFRGGDKADGMVMSFVRGGHMAALVSETSPALQRIEYRLQDGTFIRRAYMRPDITPETPFVDQPIAEGIKSLDVGFWTTGTWVQEWSSATLQSDSLPRMVRMDVTFEDGKALHQIFAVGGGS